MTDILTCEPSPEVSINYLSQHLTQRYRCNAVDYVLISLRIAIEHGHLLKLSKLTLNNGSQMSEHSPHEPLSPLPHFLWDQMLICGDESKHKEERGIQAGYFSVV
jgi:hypothetical protein